MSFKIKDLVSVLAESGITKFHIIHSMNKSETSIVRIHIPMNSDIKALEKNLYYKTPVGLHFDMRLSAKSYFKDQMIKQYGNTAKITTCLSFKLWDEECDANAN